MLANGAMFGVVLAAAMLWRGDIRAGRLADNDNDRGLCVVIVVFNPLVQSLAEQRNYAVAEENRSDCKAMEHRLQSAKIPENGMWLEGNNEPIALISTPANELQIV